MPNNQPNGTIKITIDNKAVEFAHTAVNNDMHLFIDGYHNTIVCPECIKPGVFND